MTPDPTKDQTFNGEISENGDSNVNGGAETKKRNWSRSSSSYMTDDVEEGKCGWLGFTPSCLQCCNNATGYLVVYCFFVIVQGMLVNGFVYVSISTLERRFGLLSSETGVVSTGYDIAFCVLTMFVTYFGSRSHRPRLVAIGSFIMGLGALVFALPHFTTGLYEYKQDFSDKCLQTNGTNCEGSQSNLQNYVYVFILGQLLHGAGCTPLYTLGLAFIEDSVPKKSASVYLGIGNAASVFGPVVGYGLGGVLLGIWVDFDVVDPSTIDIDPSDPRWVGAWWLGFLLAMGCAFCLTIPLLGFPRDFPGAAKHRAMRETETYGGGDDSATQEDFGKSIRDFPKALWTLFKNPTYLFTCLAGSSESMVITGFSTFLPKIIENEFQQSAGLSAIMAGIISIPGGIVGHVLAGIIVQKLKMKTANILKFNAVCCVLVCIGAPSLFLYCKNIPVAGITAAYGSGTEIGGTLASACNTNCTCQEEFFIPVCGADNINYFTACHAGCTDSMDINGTLYYTNCSCISNTTSDMWQAKNGLCESSCTTLPTFLGIFFVVVMLTFMSTTPALVVTFRVVPANMRNFAIGVQWLVVRGLGGIPGPILFGFVIDFSCILWQVRECGERGSCWIYDADEMAINVMIISIACKLMAAIFFLLACFFYKPPVNINGSETELKAQTEAVNEAFQPDENDSVVMANGTSLGDAEPVTVL